MEGTAFVVAVHTFLGHSNGHYTHLVFLLKRGEREVFRQNGDFPVLLKKLHVLEPLFGFLLFEKQAEVCVHAVSPVDVHVDDATLEIVELDFPLVLKRVLGVVQPAPLLRLLFESLLVD